MDGGASLLGMDMSLKSQDPTRYAALHHPGDAFAYDIFSQVGATLQERRGLRHPRRPARATRRRPRRVAVGDVPHHLHQRRRSARPGLRRLPGAFPIRAGRPAGRQFHIRRIEPLGRHRRRRSRSGRTCASRSSRSSPKPTFSAACRHGLLLRQAARQRWLRVWEIPGAAHADNYTIQVAPIDTGSAPLDDIVAAYAPTNMLMGQQLGHYINFAPQHHYVVQAAIAALTTWVRTGEPAPSCPAHRGARNRSAPTDSGSQRPRPGRHQDAVGGRPDRADIRRRRPEESRTSWPRSSAPANRSTPPRCAGSTRRATEYLESFTAALDAAIQSGFILPADRAEILELAAATYPYS